MILSQFLRCYLAFWTQNNSAGTVLAPTKHGAASGAKAYINNINEL